MLRFMRIRPKALVRDKKGATAIEYGMIAALIAAVIIGLVASIGTQLNAAFNVINSELNTTES